MFESLSSLVTPQLRRSASQRTDIIHPEQRNRPAQPANLTIMAGQIPYSTQMSPQSSRRTSLSPTSASTSTSHYSASRQQSISSTSSSPSQAQNLLAKMASQGAGSPPGSHLMTPAMTPFPSPADEGAPFPGGMLGLSPPGAASRPGTERSLSQDFRSMQYDGRRQSAAEVMNLDAPARHLYDTLERMAR